MAAKVLTITSAIDEVNCDSKARFTATATREVASLVPGRNKRVIFFALFSENIVAKILRTATEKLANNVSHIGVSRMPHERHVFFFGG